MKHSRLAFRLGTALAAALALAACDDVDRLPAGHGDHDHGHGDEAGAGRLVISEAQGEHGHLHVRDVADGEPVGPEIEIEHPVSALYTSPGRRYAVVVQREADRVDFLDGGLWVEDHGDHAHDHADAPALMTLQLEGVRPTHYQDHGGLGAVFYDGLSSESLRAGFSLFSDVSIGEHRQIATQELGAAMHGTAEPLGEWVLSTYREPTAEGSLPNQVELYGLHGDHFHFERRFEPLCEGLHGSASGHGHTLFGCQDGVLAVHGDGASADGFSAAKIAVDARITQLAGHPALETFAGFSGDALYIIDPDAAEARAVEWRPDADLARVAHAMDAHGEGFLILDDEGTLHILDPHNDWETHAYVPTGVRAAGDAQPALAVAHAGERVYVSDPGGERVIVVDLEAGEAAGSFALDFAPGAMAWVGIAESHDDDHGHEHDDESGHGHEGHDHAHGEEEGHDH